MTTSSKQLIDRLRIDPNDRKAYSALKKLFLDKKDFSSLSTLIEGWAKNRKDNKDSSQSYHEAAVVVFQHTGDMERAVQLFQKALDKDPLNYEASDNLILILERKSDYQKLITFLDDRIKILNSLNGDRNYLALLYFRLGELWNKYFQQTDNALLAYNNAISFDPSLRIAIFEAREICLASSDFHTAAKLYELEAEVEPDTNRKVSLLSELAQLKSRDLNDLEGAIKALRTGLSIIPGDIQAMYDLAILLIRRAETKNEEEASADYRRCAELFYQVAQGVPENKSLEFLQSALTHAPYHDSALDLLEQIAERTQQTHILPTYWVAYINSAPQGPETDKRRMFLAKAYRESGQIEDAIFCITPMANQGNSSAMKLLQELESQRESHSSINDLDKAKKTLKGLPDASSNQYNLDSSTEKSDDLLVPNKSQPPELDQEQETSFISDSEKTLADTSGVPTLQIAQLRNAVQELVASKNHNEAASYCREILNLDPTDPEAFTFLESYYRRKRDFAQLRDLLREFTQRSGLSVDVRKLRLREIANISETKLRDMDGAIDAWNAVVALDPSDSEASNTLKRLLERTKKWDMLIQILDREALSATDIEAKFLLISQIAQIHLDKRNDLPEVVEAYRQLHSLKPDDKKIRDILSDFLLKTENYEEAIPFLKERIEECSDSKKKHRLLLLLANTLDEKLGSYEDAYQVYSHILELSDRDKNILDRLEFIDQKLKRFDKLLQRLEKRIEISSRTECIPILLRMAEISDIELSDLNRSMEYLNRALELSPRNDTVIDQLISIFEKTEKYDEVIKLLNKQIVTEKKAEKRIGYLRKIAHIQSQKLHDEDAAADSWKSILAIENDEEALRSLRKYATENDNVELLSDILEKLLPIEKHPDSQREICLELATILDSRLERTKDAISYLQRIIDKIDPLYGPALIRLASAYEKVRDYSGLAKVLEKQLSIKQQNSEKVILIHRLADIYEYELKDNNQAIRALKYWVELDRKEMEPRFRLRDLFIQSENWKDLVITLDALSVLESDEEKKNEAKIKAAELAYQKLNDINGAWGRLVPLVQQGDTTAEEAISSIAKESGYQEALAGIYINLAQMATEPEKQAKYWGVAGKIYEEELDNPVQALEAYLRMFASDLDNSIFLSHVENAAIKAKAWDRLARVYDRLIKQVSDQGNKVDLLIRHAEILDQNAEKSSEAFDCIAQALSLDPTNKTLIDHAEDLGLRAERSEELLAIYDRHCKNCQDIVEQIEFTLRSASLSYNKLKDNERTIAYLKSAIKTSESSPELLNFIEETVKDFDTSSNDSNKQYLQKVLFDVYREIAEDVTPVYGSMLVLRASRLLNEDPGNENEAFNVLKSGASLFPTDDNIYVELKRIAISANHLDALDAHLSRLIDEVLDSETTIVLLERRGKILEENLKRFSDAAEVYSKLLQLDHEHLEAQERLYMCLRQAKRYQDLLLAMDRQLKRTDDSGVELKLRKEIANIWDVDLQNRWESFDAWKKVSELSPNDRDAQEAIERLGRKSLISEANEGEYTDSDVLDPGDNKSSTLEEDEQNTVTSDKPESEKDTKTIEAKLHGTTRQGIDIIDNVEEIQEYESTVEESPHSEASVVNEENESIDIDMDIDEQIDCVK